jgi:hypothetical protein
MRTLAGLRLEGSLLLHGCAAVAVVAVAGAAAGVTYTYLGIAEKTFNEPYDAVLEALQKGLVTLDIKTGNTRKVEERGVVVSTTIEAYARDLTISIAVERITDKATRVVVDANRKYLVKDSSTATEILVQTTNNLPKRPEAAAQPQKP